MPLGRLTTYLDSTCLCSFNFNLGLLKIKWRHLKTWGIHYTHFCGCVSVWPYTSEALEMLLRYLNVFKPFFYPRLVGGRSVSTWADSRCNKRSTTPAFLQFFICKGKKGKKPTKKLMMWVKWSCQVLSHSFKRCWHDGACSQEFCFNYENVLLDGHTTYVLCCVFDNYFLLLYKMLCLSWLFFAWVVNPQWTRPF